MSGIDEYRLDANGLTVMLVPDNSAPVQTFKVTYHVGSPDQVSVVTGAKLILVQQMFTGTEGVKAPSVIDANPY